MRRIKRLSPLILVLAVILPFVIVPAYIAASMPVYENSLGDINHNEKIKGLYLLKQSAKRDDNLIIYGSSELDLMEIITHPSNFFAGKRSGFQVNVVGRGSCQSLIHALSIAASGDSLKGKKVALITSPQSYVEHGIAPDLFMANFSSQQFLELLQDPALTEDVKQRLSDRIHTLVSRYENQTGNAAVDPAVKIIALNPKNAALTPYRALSNYLLDIKDKYLSRKLLNSTSKNITLSANPVIDWQVEEAAAIKEAVAASSNNDFGMLNDYYTTNIGSRLERLKDRDVSLSYSESEEYGDLRLLFEICRQKGVEPLFIHVPMHGDWSDHVGFDAARRREYYKNVREIALEYEINTLDLTEYEYEDYFLCDVMHLGWKGWLEVDKALIEYYHGN